MSSGQTKKLLAIALLAPSVLLAGGISAPHSIPSTSLLPKGVRSVTYLGVMAEANTRYNDQGQSENLGEAFTSDVTFQDLIDGEDGKSAQLDAAAIVKANGYGTNDSIGNTTGDLSIGINANTPIAAYGISEKWTMGIAIPVVSKDISVDTGSISNGALQAVVDNEGGPENGNQATVEKIRNKYQNAVSDKLDDYGYQPLGDESSTELGDIVIASKNRLLKNDRFELSTSNSIALPTSRKKDVNKVVDITAGDGQWDLEAGLIGKLNVTDRFHLLTNIAYVIQFSDTIEARIPYKDSSNLTPDIDNNTTRDLGDIFKTGAGFGWEMTEGFTVASYYTYQTKEADEYSGDAYDAGNYAFLSDETEQSMQSYQVALSYNTFSLFKKKTFAVPLSATLNHTRVFEGRNVVNNSMTSMNLSVYF